MDALITRFKTLNIEKYPDFHSYNTILGQALWVLLVAKDEFNIKRIAAYEISRLIREIMEISISPIQIKQALRRAGDKVHVHNIGGLASSYEIMRPGREYLKGKTNENGIELFYFQPGQKFSSKRLLTNNILNGLSGDLKIVDPYCGTRTLDCLSEIRGLTISFLTKIEKLGQKAAERFLRELKDFLPENPTVEFREYPHSDLHDRYILSKDSLILLGHSIKDLGGKESFAIALHEKANMDILHSLRDNFDIKWKQSSILK